MTSSIDITSIAGTTFKLERIWNVTVQTPEVSAEDLISILEKEIDLTHGAYSKCLYVRYKGASRFKSEIGASGGAERRTREVESVEVVLGLPYDTNQLAKVIDIIAHYHVHEEPTIILTDCWRTIQVGLERKDSSNRYWNRTDRDILHGREL